MDISDHPVTAAVRTSGTQAEFPQMQIRKNEGLAILDDRSLILSVREFELLAVLVERANHVVQRDDLAELAWGVSARAGDRSVDVYVYKLRQRLKEIDPDWNFIHTHVGYGYRFKPERR